MKDDRGPLKVLIIEDNRADARLVEEVLKDTGTPLTIRTFSRGGSDITGAIVARAADAECYENWTDVSGFLMADPRIVPDAKVIHAITYQELRELAYMGATVLHEESVFPVQRAGIPTNIRTPRCTPRTHHPPEYLQPDTDSAHRKALQRQFRPQKIRRYERCSRS